MDNGKDVQFRALGDFDREIKHIAPEELAAGMYEIIKQNISVEKNGLYRTLAAQCGVSRVGKAVYEVFDAALHYLDKEVMMEGDKIFLTRSNEDTN